MPEVVGVSVADAARTLREAGLRYAVVNRSSSKPPGTVIGQRPAAATKAEARSVVQLDVAKPASVLVSSVVGLTAAAAERRLRALGLRVDLTTVASSRPKGTVISQSPVAGAQLRKGMAVDLRISSGPARVTVPDVTGLAEDAARSKLSAAGFDVQVVDEPTDDPSQDGIVLQQNPAGGGEASKGATVTLTVARLNG